MKKALFVAVVLLAGVAQALDTPAAGTLDVTATVVPVCTVATVAVNFGEYKGEELTATGTIAVVCSKSEPFDIKLDRGSHANSGWRRVALLGSGTDDGSYLKYKLSKPDEQEWTDEVHDGDGPAASALHAEGTGLEQAFTVKGVLFGAEQNGYPKEGTYTDVVNVTVVY